MIKTLAKTAINYIDPYSPFRLSYIFNRCIFVHIPKTAGTSVLRMLTDTNRILRMSSRSMSQKHIGWESFMQYHSNWYEHFFKFTFVRDPYARAISTYRYLLSGGNGRDDLALRDWISAMCTSFEDFAFRVLTKDRIHEHALFRPQYTFIFDITGTCRVDFVGRVESFDNDVKYVADQLGIVFSDTPRENVSVGHIHSTRLTPAARERVYELYSKDFELLKYQR